MKKQICAFAFILLLFAFLASAEPLSIILKSPSDKAIIKTYTQDFIFDFNQIPDLLNCSLIVDSEIKVVRNSLLVLSNNKLTTELSAGSHTWFIRCYDKNLNEIISGIRSFSIELSTEVKEGYEALYNKNGLRSYLITIAPDQKPIILPAMKGGEDIQIQIGGKIYYLDIIKMGSSVNTTFVDVRDRSTGKTYKMLTPSTMTFDFNTDETIDIELSLVNVDRTVDAYFVVTPYPGAPPPSQPTQPETPTEEPTPPSPPPSETPVEEPVTQPSQPETGEEEVSTEEQPEPEPLPEKETQEKSTKWLFIIIIAVVVVIILVIVLIASKSKAPKKKTGEEIRKDTTKKKEPDVKALPPEKTSEEKAVPEKKGRLSMLDNEELAPTVEKFDIIKSSSRRMKR